MKTIRPIICASMLVLCLLQTSHARPETPRPANLEELQEAIAEVVARREVPALGIALVDRNGPVWVGAIGKADLEEDRDADEQSLFRIGSTSKIFVALSVLRLVEEGRLSLDDELAALAPEVAFSNPWETTHPVRIVHLLEHTSGWDEIHYPEFARNDPTPSRLAEDLAFHPHSRTSRWPPGARFSYTNSGPAVAAYVVEKVSGQSFESYVEEHFFEPIGMTTASHLYSDEVKARGVTLYRDDGRALDYWHFSMRPSSSINASPADMAQLALFFIRRGTTASERILSESSLARMERVESTDAAKAGQQAGYGLANYSSPHGPWVYREHNGGFDGAICEFAYLSEAQQGYAFMINQKNRLAVREISSLIRDFQTRELSAEAPDLGQELNQRHRLIEGIYHPINPRIEKLAFLFHFRRLRRFSFRGDTLRQTGMLGGRGTAYVAVSESLYASPETGLVSLARVDDPLAGEVLHDSSKDAGSGNNVTLKRMPTWLACTQLAVEFLWILVMVSSLGYFLVWSVRRLRGKIPAGATMRVRTWPFLATLSIVLSLVLMRAAAGDYYGWLGHPTFISIGVMLTTASYPLFSLMALITVFRERKSPMNRGNYWYCAGSSLVHTVMALYMANFGVIGIRFWT